MAFISFDAVESIKELKTAGFTEDQAEAQVKVLLEAIKHTEATRLDEFSTKHDLKELELRITETIAEVRREVADVRLEIAESKSEVIKWVAGMLVVQSGILIGGFFAIVKLLLS